MSKSNAFKQHEYAVEEKHRGDWIPMPLKDKEGKKIGEKVVKITEETAETMNIDSEKVGIRYVKKEVQSNGGGDETPAQKAIRLKGEIKVAATAEEVDKIAEGGTPAVIKAAEERKNELIAIAEKNSLMAKIGEAESAEDVDALIKDVKDSSRKKRKFNGLIS